MNNRYRTMGSSGYRTIWPLGRWVIASHPRSPPEPCLLSDVGLRTSDLGLRTVFHATRHCPRGPGSCFLVLATRHCPYGISLPPKGYSLPDGERFPASRQNTWYKRDVS